MNLLEFLNKADTFTPKQKEIAFMFLSSLLEEAGCNFYIDTKLDVIICNTVDDDSYSTWVDTAGNAMVTVIPGKDSVTKAERNCLDYKDVKKLQAKLN